MTNRVTMGSPIQRVKCVVNTCRYHQNENQCGANEIEIQVPGARNTQETDCATFAPLETN